MSILLIEDRHHLRTITLNRPERRNALTPELIEDLIAALRVDPHTTRVVRLRGAGSAFCSGLDLEVLREAADRTAEQHRIEAERVSRLFRALWDCPVPSVAQVHGPAIAGGSGLALFSDFTLATPDALFGFTEARIGFVPALVSAYLALQAGDKVARDLLLTARTFHADEALRFGLLTEVVPADRLGARTDQIIDTLLRNSPESLRATKRLLRAQHQLWLDEACALSLEANAASRSTHDFREGVTAFLEKRQPVWQ